MSKPNSTLKKVNEKLYELEFFTQNPKLKESRKSVRRIKRHKEREDRRNEFKSEDVYLVVLNGIEFRTTGVKNEEDAISKVSNFKPFRDLVAKMKRTGKSIDIEAKKL